MSLATVARAEDLSELEDESQLVVVDHIRVASEDSGGFAEAWAQETEVLKGCRGFVAAQLRSTGGGDGVYASIVVWSSAQAWRDSLQAEVAQRLAARFLRSGQAPVSSLRRFGRVEIDPAAREVRKDGKLVRLTFKEYELLLALVSSPRRVFSRDELMDRVWGYRSVLETGTLSVHIRRLRAKLEDDPAEPRYLRTVWGIGYRFEP